jgi:glycosyltransferase involved in cell wall biosynthesis
MRRDVLVIAYYFPPMGLSGVQRSAKFVKYLPDHNWHPVVLTVAPRGYYAYDASLLEEVQKAGVEVIRTETLDPTRMYRKGKTVALPRESVRKFMNRVSQTIFIPDNKIGWRKRAIRKIRKLRDKYNFELVFSTAPPFTDHIIGRDISKELNLPLVLDYRDAWLDYQFAFYPTPYHRYANYRLEKSCILRASKIVAVNRKIKIKILEKYPSLHYNDVVIIPQGYDPADFEVNTLPPPPDAHTMQVLYTGTFIEDITPVPLLQAVAKIFRENPQLKGRIKLTFAGLFRKEHKAILKKLGLQNDVALPGYIEHRECTKLMMRSDVLYITLGNRKNRDHVTMGKLYDYFGARKPILAAVPEGIVSQIVKETGAGVVTDPDNVHEIANALMQYFEKFQRRELEPVPQSAVEKYDRTKLTGELAKIFNQVTEYKFV